MITNDAILQAAATLMVPIIQDVPNSAPLRKLVENGTASQECVDLAFDLAARIEARRAAMDKEALRRSHTEDSAALDRLTPDWIRTKGA